MLRVGLTGGLASGKSTVAEIFAVHGAHIFYADEIGRSLMQPGQPVYTAIVDQFGQGIVRNDGSLNRSELARIAFDDGRIEELNAIVHPATIAQQAKLIEALASRHPNAVAMVESALIFETRYGGEGGWHRRFDRIVFVRASEELKLARYVARSLNGNPASIEERAVLQAEARRRLVRQNDSDRNAERSDYILTNNGSLEDLRGQVDALWPLLKELAMQPDLSRCCNAAPADVDAE